VSQDLREGSEDESSDPHPEVLQADMHGGKYLFRGDDNYRGDPVGLAFGPEADRADIQNLAVHVLGKKSNTTSRFTSFTTETKVARRFTTRVDHQNVRKVELAELQEMESRGSIRIWDPDEVFESLKVGPRKHAKQAGDVRSAMRRNREILIEGRIPASILKPVDK